MKKILYYIFQESGILIMCCVLLALYLVIFANINRIYYPHEQLSDLSKSLIMGHLYLDNPQTNLGDLAFYNNHYYVFYGIFPSILLIPFVLAIPFISQHILAIPAVALTIFSLWKIGKHFRLNNTITSYFVAAFVLGTPYFFLASVNITAYQIQAVSTSLLLGTLYFYLCRKNFLLAGLLFGFAVMTRMLLVVGLIFFIADILLAKNDLTTKFLRLLAILSPIILCLGISAMYNFLRFGSLSSGYDLSINIADTPLFSTAKAVGTFSFTHFPSNFYYAFIKTLDPINDNLVNNILRFPYFKANEAGMSILLTSPYVIYMLAAKVKKGLAISAWLSVIIVAVFDLSFYTSGIWTYGYRYALDFLPFAFIILASSFQTRFDNRTKALIIFSILFNAFFMYSIWNAYPFLPFLKLP